MTQAQLEVASGVKQGTISKIERGDQESTGFIVELAEALDVSAKYLRESGKPESFEINDKHANYTITTTPGRRKLNDVINQFPDEDLAAVVQIFEGIISLLQKRGQ